MTNHHNFKDKSGQRFGRILVQSFSHKGGTSLYFKCLCDCGKTFYRASARLNSSTVANASWEDDGGNIRQLEKLIKVTLGGRYLSQDILPQGYTETLPPWYLERLLDFVKKLNNKNKD